MAGGEDDFDFEEEEDEEDDSTSDTIVNFVAYSNFLNNRDDVQLNKLSLKIHFKMLNCSKYAIIN